MLLDLCLIHKNMQKCEQDAGNPGFLQPQQHVGLGPLAKLQPLLPVSSYLSTRRGSISWTPAGFGNILSYKIGIMYKNILKHLFNLKQNIHQVSHDRNIPKHLQIKITQYSSKFPQVYCRQVSTKCPGRRLHHLFSVIVVYTQKKSTTES